MPADGEQIEAALEATTGWRFMVEELRAVGAEVHLAEPAETSALVAEGVPRCSREPFGTLCVPLLLKK
jgi:hypothetical protein